MFAFQYITHNYTFNELSVHPVVNKFTGADKNRSSYSLRSGTSTSNYRHVHLWPSLYLQYVPSCHEKLQRLLRAYRRSIGRLLPASLARKRSRIACRDFECKCQARMHCCNALRCTRACRQPLLARGAADAAGVPSPEVRAHPKKEGAGGRFTFGKLGDEATRACDLLPS